MSEHVVSMYLQRKSGTRETRALQSVWAAPPCAPRSAPARARRAARARAHRPRRPEPGAAPGAGRGGRRRPQSGARLFPDLSCSRSACRSLELTDCTVVHV